MILFFNEVVQRALVLVGELSFVFCCMKAVLIAPKTATEFKFISDLLKKLGMSSATMSKEDLEDLGLSKLLKSVDKTKKVTRESIVQKLKS